MRFPTFLDDCTAALADVATVQIRPNGTPRRRFVGGWSAGACAAIDAGLDLTAEIVPGRFHQSLLRHLADPGTAERDTLDAFLAAH